ncbi:MAG TPA: Tat pathway signal sequence domain protein, partial [Caulobacteraceae bacterium]|nr:Tat pathway signal sequence domain protein [Caulobacteraceae bacterium]
MRRILLLALMAATLIPASSAMAQGRRPDSGEDQADQDRKRRNDQDFSDFQAPLPGLANAGPCPYVKVLYDASRYVEFKENKEATADVGYTGEIEGISAACAYKGSEPITIDMIVTFSLGKGPMASGSAKDYTYWVAVT